MPSLERPRAIWVALGVATPRRLEPSAKSAIAGSQESSKRSAEGAGLAFEIGHQVLVADIVKIERQFFTRQRLQLHRHVIEFRGARQ